MSGLTEKKMANKKFRNNENAIFVAYYKFRDCPSAKMLARHAGISRSTLYRHHKSPHFIPENYEKYILEIYSRRIKSFLKQDAPLKKLFFRKLVFIHNHRVIFEVLFNDGRKDIVKEMIEIIRGPILAEWNYKNPEKLYKVYRNEILGLIEAWSEKGFRADEIEVVLNDMVYLSKAAPKHLARFL